MKYTYFVSYQFKHGFGCCSVVMPKPINNYAGVMEMRKTIEQIGDKGTIIIINFILLEAQYDNS